MNELSLDQSNKIATPAVYTAYCELPAVKEMGEDAFNKKVRGILSQIHYQIIQDIKNQLADGGIKCGSIDLYSLYCYSSETASVCNAVKAALVEKNFFIDEDNCLDEGNCRLYWDEKSAQLARNKKLLRQQKSERFSVYFKKLQQWSSLPFYKRWVSIKPQWDSDAGVEYGSHFLLGRVRAKNPQVS